MPPGDGRLHVQVTVMVPNAVRLTVKCWAGQVQALLDPGLKDDVTSERKQRL